MMKVPSLPSQFSILFYFTRGLNLRPCCNRCWLITRRKRGKCGYLDWLRRRGIGKSAETMALASRETLMQEKEKLCKWSDHRV
eukprot:scaffold145431_cov17-Tisochrysis_lutea.AAC.1